LQVLVANESDKDVWFDQVEVSVEPALIVQEQHYDPFGLVLSGIDKGGDPPHPYLYNESSEKQQDVLGEGYAYETPLRNYDPQLGRFHGVDILAEEFASLSPYQYAFNNPMLYSDPTGAKPVAIQDMEAIWRNNGGISGGGGGWSDVADLIGMPNTSWSQGIASQRAGYLPGYGVGSRNYSGPLGNPDRPVGPFSAAAYGLLMASFNSAPQGTTHYGNIQAGVWTERYKDWTVKGKHVGSTLISRSFKPLQGGRNPLMEHANMAYSWEDFMKENAGLTYEEIIHQRGIDPKTRQPLGPRIMFVFDPLDKNAVIDMRHLLVQGKNGRLAGGLYEFYQSICFWCDDGRRASGTNMQDFYSNELGHRFFENVEGQRGGGWFLDIVFNRDERAFINRLNYFLTTPAYRGSQIFTD